MWPWPPAEACSLILKGRHVASHPLSSLSPSPKLPPPAWPSVWPAWGCLSLFSCPLSLLRPVKLRSAQPSAPGEDALHLRDEVITGGKTRGCRSPGFQLPWKHVSPMEGWELSAMEGGGGTGEAHFLEGSPHCPPVPHGLGTPTSRPRGTTAGLGPGLGQGWVSGTEHGHVFVHTRPWQAVLSVCSGCEVTLLWMCPGAA